MQSLIQELNAQILIFIKNLIASVHSLTDDGRKVVEEVVVDDQLTPVTTTKWLVNSV